MMGCSQQGRGWCCLGAQLAHGTEVAPLFGVQISLGTLCRGSPAEMGALGARSLAGAQCPGQGSAAWAGWLYLCCGQPLQL